MRAEEVHAGRTSRPKTGITPVVTATVERIRIVLRAPRIRHGAVVPGKVGPEVSTGQVLRTGVRLVVGIFFRSGNQSRRRVLVRLRVRLPRAFLALPLSRPIQARAAVRGCQVVRTVRHGARRMHPRLTTDGTALDEVVAGRHVAAIAGSRNWNLSCVGTDIEPGPGGLMTSRRERRLQRRRHVHDLAVRIPLEAQAPRTVVDCDHVGERSFESSDD